MARAHFGQGVGPIYLDMLECIGTEQELQRCVHRGVGIHSCDHGEDAGVQCSSKKLNCMH